MNYLIDTNVLLRICNFPNERDEKIIQSVFILLKSGKKLSICPQTLYEFWAVATRPLNVNGFGRTNSEVKNEIDRLLQNLVFLRQEEKVFDRWFDLVSKYNVKGKQVHDARIVAAMLTHGVRQLLTLNVDDFKRFEEIKAVDPSEIVA